MKKIIFSLLAVLLLFVGANAQNEAPTIGELEKVVNVSLSKSLLFTNAQQWASANDPTSKKKIDIVSNENGTIVVKFETNDQVREQSLTNYLSYKYRLSIKLDCKDEKYRWTISNPSVLVGADNNVEYKYLSSSKLTIVKNELETVERISIANFQKILDWELEKVVSIINSNLKEQDSINNQIANSNDKKEKKKLGYKIEQINEDNLVLIESINRWNIIQKRIIEELEKSMSVNNDF
jgi:hypothetical protein